MVFQSQYYDTPRKPGARIEAPDTLGRKCWAFACLRQYWQPDAITAAVAAAGLELSNFTGTFPGAVPRSMDLCSKVMANCFVNASYDPALRNGTCPPKIATLHYPGFERENAKRGFEVHYPFYDEQLS